MAFHAEEVPLLEEQSFAFRVVRIVAGQAVSFREGLMQHLFFLLPGKAGMAGEA